MDPMMGGGSLSPEQIQALMEYGVGQGAFAEQDRAIQQQLAQAMALRNRPQTPHTTGGGAMYGGIGDLLTQVAGQNQEKNQRADDAALQQERIKALRALAAAYGQQQQPPMQPETGFLDPGVAAAYAGRRRQQANPYYMDPGAGGD